MGINNSIMPNSQTKYHLELFQKKLPSNGMNAWHKTPQGQTLEI